MSESWPVAVVGIVVLLLFSAFFSGSETSMTAASRPRLHRLEQKGSRRARAVNRLLARKERMIGAILLGNNLANILASALATGLMISFFGDAGVIYATIAMTALVLVFAEVLPKTYAINHADRTALLAAPLLSRFVALLAPATAAMQALVAAMLRLLGVRLERSASAAESDDLLRGAIDLHGASVHDARAMLRGILDLGEVAVQEIMTHRSEVDMIDADLPAGRIVDMAMASPYTRLPLWRDDPDNVIGVLHAKALLRAVRAHEGPIERLEVQKVAGAPWFIPETTELLHQLQAFRTRREHFALVVDEYGSLMGVVTLEDILEEIVGEIDDEHDIPVRGVRPQSGGAYIVAGTVTIRDLNRRFDWSLPDDEASTIAGLVLHEARRIPRPGQVFEFYGFRFEILRRQRNQIELMRLTPPRPAADRDA